MTADDQDNPSHESVNSDDAHTSTPGGPVLNEDPARCMTCYYVIENLPENRCPECGQPFDLNDEFTFVRKPPFVRWRLWMPGMLLALTCGTITTSVLLLYGSTGWAVTLGVPVAIGAILGYLCRIPMVLIALLTIFVAFGVVVMLMIMNISGMLCGLIAMAMFAPPALAGVFLGLGLRTILKRTEFDQRSYLPAILLFVGVMGWGMLEKQLATPRPIETITSETVLVISAADAWNRLAFYEECTGLKPWLLRIAGPVPVRTITEPDGITRTCIYEKGSIRKRVTRVETARLLAFDVLDHDIGEERSVRLVGGSFALEPLSANRTRITLTTRYQPKLTPRVYWRPYERFVCHSVHTHVLNGMRRHPADVVQMAEAKALSRADHD